MATEDTGRRASPSARMKTGIVKDWLEAKGGASRLRLEGFVVAEGGNGSGAVRAVAAGAAARGLKN
ncbi:hydroxymethylbilane synthase [Sesbania bispinosa]|nr:hydroxymethylbilane synthase [Sesbania bispinosa]